MNDASTEFRIGRTWIIYDSGVILFIALYIPFQVDGLPRDRADCVTSTIANYVGHNSTAIE